MPKEFALRAMDEIEHMLALSSSDYVVRYFDSFFGGGTQVNIVMEFCDNGDLEKYLTRRKGE
jgi:serine/threonine protein kinase